MPICSLTKKGDLPCFCKCIKKRYHSCLEEVGIVHVKKQPRPKKRTWTRQAPITTATYQEMDSITTKAEQKPKPTKQALYSLREGLTCWGNKIQVYCKAKETPTLEFTFAFHAILIPKDFIFSRGFSTQLLQPFITWDGNSCSSS